MDGTIDLCGGGLVAGWAVENGLPAELEILVNSASIARIKCAVSRPDLVPHGYPADAGFVFEFSNPLSASDVVLVRSLDGKELRNSPVAPLVHEGEAAICTISGISGWAIVGGKPAELGTAQEVGLLKSNLQRCCAGLVHADDEYLAVGGAVEQSIKTAQRSVGAQLDDVSPEYVAPSAGFVGVIAPLSECPPDLCGDAGDMSARNERLGQQLQSGGNAAIARRVCEEQFCGSQAIGPGPFYQSSDESLSKLVGAGRRHDCLSRRIGIVEFGFRLEDQLPPRLADRRFISEWRRKRQAQRKRPAWDDAKARRELLSKILRLRGIGKLDITDPRIPAAAG
jgi:hypothetical protein